MNVKISNTSSVNQSMLSQTNQSNNQMNSSFFGNSQVKPNQVVDHRRPPIQPQMLGLQKA
jgi:hypothetical protein